MDNYITRNPVEDEYLIGQNALNIGSLVIVDSNYIISALSHFMLDEAFVIYLKKDKST